MSKRNDGTTGQQPATPPPSRLWLDAGITATPEAAAAYRGLSRAGRERVKETIGAACGSAGRHETYVTRTWRWRITIEAMTLPHQPVEVCITKLSVADALAPHSLGAAFHFLYMGVAVYYYLTHAPLPPIF